MKKKPKHGGPRPGSGRPSMFAEAVAVKVMMEREVHDRLSELALASGVSIPALVRKATDQYLARRKKGRK